MVFNLHDSAHLERLYYLCPHTDACIGDIYGQFVGFVAAYWIFCICCASIHWNIDFDGARTTTRIGHTDKQ